MNPDVISRYSFWYVFGLAALALILMRFRPTYRGPKGPLTISFNTLVFLSSFGTLCKQPILAESIDTLLGPNAAWLLADILFIAGLCGGTYWVDLLTQPDLLERADWRLLRRLRVVMLLMVATLMVTAARLEAPTWSIVERGGINVGGQWLLLGARTGYFAYSLWGLGYIGLSFYRQLQHMIDRSYYLRLTLPWFAVMLALGAPVLQLFGTWYVFFRPDQNEWLWPLLWKPITLVQVGVASLVLATFFGPAYRGVIWLDKQLLVQRLWKAYKKFQRTRPDIVQPLPASPGSIVLNVDWWLATLVNGIETIKILSGRPEGEINAPAGRVMPASCREILKREQALFAQALSTQKGDMPPCLVTGDYYALARWYAMAI